MGDIEKKSRKAGDIHRRRRQYDHIVQFTRPTWIHCCYQRVAGNLLQTVAISESTRSNHMAVIVTYIDVSETIAIERSFQYFGRDFIVPRVCLCSPTGYFTKISFISIHFSRHLVAEPPRTHKHTHHGVESFFPLSSRNDEAVTLKSPIPTSGRNEQFGFCVCTCILNLIVRIQVYSTQCVWCDIV